MKLRTVLVLAFFKLSFAVQIIDLQSCDQDLTMDLGLSQLPPELTICLHFSLKFLQPSIILNLDEELKVSLTNFEQNYGFFRVQNASWLFQWEDSIMPDTWNWLCLSYKAKKVNMVLNEKMVFQLELPKNSPRIFNGKLLFKNSMVHLQKVGHLQAMPSSLNLETLSCNEIASSNNNEWKTYKIEESCFNTSEIDLNELCSSNGDIKGIVIVQEQMQYENALLACNALGGNLFLPNNQKELNLLSSIQNSTPEADKVWIGATKSSLKFNDIIDTNAKEVQFKPWSENNPNGGRIQRCITNQADKGYTDRRCEKEYPFPCEMPKNNFYVIKGQVPKGLDSVYLFNPAEGSTLRGVSKSFMVWQNNQYIIDNLLFLSSVQKQSKIPPLGLKTWKDSSGKELQLKLTQCKFDEFTCNQIGNCIPLSKRCDGKIDCTHDQSDEVDCDLFSTKGLHKIKTHPPPGDKVVVNVSLHVKNIIAINELSMEFKMRLKVSLKWNDPRLIFKNLKDNEHDNSVMLEHAKGIWLPTLLFDNSFDGERTFFDEKAVLTVIKNGTASRESQSEILENFLYPGSENPFVLARYYTLTLHCAFDLKYYPFDNQHCHVKFAIPFNEKLFVQLLMESQPTTEDLSMLEYHFISFSKASTKPDNKVQVEILLRRVYAHHIAKVYLPTVCLIIIAELTLFIDHKHFEASIMVTLTSMLVMFTLYQSISATLPQTAHLKMIDIWLLVGFIIPFFVFIILIGTDMNTKEKSPQGAWCGEPKTRRHCRRAKYLIPVFTSFFIVSYFSFGLYVHGNL